MSLLDYSQHREENSAADIGVCLELSTGDMDLNRAYSFLKRWYLHTSARAPNPSQGNMAKVTKDYATLYQWEDPYPPG